ncbi:Protein PTST homolog 2, chloroplastic [Linum perenne]
MFSVTTTSIFTTCCGRAAVVKRWREQGRNRSPLQCTMLTKDGGFVARKRTVRDSFRECGVSNDWGSGVGDSSLEDEILEFMKSSEEPGMFPSKKQLIDAGRMDLVEGIVREGGWMASGWDLEGDSEGLDSVSEEDCYRELSDVTSSSGRSLETAAEDDSGVEGILSRLEIERSMNFGLKLPERREGAHVWGQHPSYDEPSTISESTTVPDINGRINDSPGKLGYFIQSTNVNGLENALKPDAWRTWSAQRAECSPMASEGGVFLIQKSGETDAKETRSGNELNSKHANKKANLSEAGLDSIRTRLQRMESELSTVLNALKSDGDADESHKDIECSTEDELLKFNDAWEFRETEITSQQAKLRSIRAKLVVLEGRRALAVIDAQRLISQKQKRITDVRKAVQLLRTVNIVWPNNRASEVFLTGSFDEWATQRKMDKSSSGVFSLHMKLYPGKYEMKFIVDGEWKVDPLRPIVNNNGFVNNLLVID